MEAGAGARSLAPVGDAGSHLNMAEIEFSVLSRQCLNRRIPDMTTLKEEVAAWCDERNGKETWILD